MRPAEHRPPGLAPDVPFDSLANWDRHVFGSRPYSRVLYYAWLILYATTSILCLHTKKTIYLVLWLGSTLVLIVGVLIYTIRLWMNFHQHQKSVDEENRLYKSERDLKKQFQPGEDEKDRKLGICEKTEAVGDHKIESKE